MVHYFSSFNFLLVCEGAKNVIPCPDQHAYDYYFGVKVNKNQRLHDNIDYGFDGYGNFHTNLKQGDKIVVILESPHVKEYSTINGSFVPIGPLISSWEDFCTYFNDELLRACNSKNTKLSQSTFISFYF